MDSDSQTAKSCTIEQPCSRELNHANVGLLLEALDQQFKSPPTEEWYTYIEVTDKETGEITTVKVLY